MTELVLYLDDRSPPVRSILMLIERLQLKVTYKYVDLFKGEQLQEDFLQLNPAHTVPTLQHGDLILTDSHAILIHLCEQFEKHADAGKELWPKGYEERMLVLNRLFFECSILFRRDSEFLSAVIRAGYDKVNVNYHENKINEAYTMMERFLARHTYMASNQLSLADISIVTTLATIQMVFPVHLSKWPKLTDWFKRMQILPEFALNNNGLKRLRTAMETLGKLPFPSTE